jgi:hypothetical protein
MELIRINFTIGDRQFSRFDLLIYFLGVAYFIRFSLEYILCFLSPRVIEEEHLVVDRLRNLLLKFVLE